jgi:anti-sigma regulatory factor (Ser/Thr protein kinase)
VVVSGVLAGLDAGPDLAVARLAGGLRLGTVPDVRRVLAKLLVHPGWVAVDLSAMRLEWHPAVRVFPAALDEAGGWPAAGLVLYGADADMAAGLTALRVTARVPLVADRAAAERRVFLRPEHVRRDRDLPADLTAPYLARAFVRETCVAWDADDSVSDALVIATELVSNAVEHAGTSSRISVRLDPRGLWVDVRDFASGAVPRPRPRAIGSRRGRGLHLVASMAPNWGVTQHPDGKTVWASIPRAR